MCRVPAVKLSHRNVLHKLESINVHSRTLLSITNPCDDEARRPLGGRAAVKWRASAVPMAEMSGALTPNGSATDDEPARRRSVFYVPLFESFDNYLPLTAEEKEALICGQNIDEVPIKPKRRNASQRLQISRGDSSMTESESEINTFSPQRRMRRPLSSTISSNEALARIVQRELTSSRLSAENSPPRHSKPRLRSTTSCEPRYDRVFSPLGGSVSTHKLNNSTSSIGNRLTSKSPIRNSNLSLIPDSPKLLSPNKEKSKTLPQNLNTPSPIRGSSSSSSIFKTPKITVTPESPNKSPGKISGLNFIRRSRSTKLSRSNSLLRSITARHIEEGLDDTVAVVTNLTEDFDKFVGDNGGQNEVIGALIKKNEAEVANSPLSIRRGYLDVDDEVAVHSDTSYEKACRRGSAPSTPVPGAQAQHSPSRLASFFFSKRSFRSNPLKRTKSATKLERERALAAAPTHPPAHALRTSRSHESLLSAHSPAVSTMDLGPPNQVEIRALHSSVLGRPHCFALSAENRAPRYFACASRRERDRWIYSLRQAARPDEIRTRRCERTVKLWLLEAKAIPPKKRYYCEILLDDTLYARSSSKLKSELCFWGEVYEFGALPAVRNIHVNVYREPERRARKRDKHALVGTVRIPVDDVSSRYLNERWYPLSEEKPQSPARGAAPPPALRIKCRYQCVEVLPLDCYARFLDYLRRNYRRLCEYLEPVIGVKAKEDIGCALVLCMAGAGMAPRYLADVVALDVRRTGDHSLTFRGNSLATKSMEAYLKLVGDQYLQETLGEAVRRSARRCAPCALALKSNFACHSGDARRGAETLGEALCTLRAGVKVQFRLSLRRRSAGITHEYPNERAARNLTLVAKTLQTLANFTRFQGKEAFMEFLNDFLEQEAPNMKAFLRAISTRPQEQQQSPQEGGKRESCASQGSGTGSEGSRGEGSATVEPDPDWAPHVDLGKQLATLHGLLVDSLPKLPAARIQELEPLSDILEELSKRLASNDNGPMAPISDNIFRFNDPTCNTPTKHSSAEAPPNGQLNSNFAHSSPIMSKNGVQFNISPSKSNADESKYKGAYVSKSPSFNPRSATLPRNGYGTNPNNQSVNPDRYSSQYNNQEHCVNLKVVQIGFGSDQYPKGISNGLNESLERRFQDRYKPNYNQQQPHFHNSNYAAERSPSSDSVNHNYCANDMQNIMKETATLEELSDLLKYADDSDIVDDKLNNKKNVSQSKSTNNNNNNNNNIVNGNNKSGYTNNGSNVSISGLSNVASSGYQSIATYSQSSSPIENAAHHHQAYENGGQPMSRYSQLNYQKQREKQYYDSKNEKFYPKSPVQQKIEYDIQKYGIQNFTTADSVQAIANANPKIAPLVFTNPVYNMDDNRQPQEKNANGENRNSKRCPCGSSSSSIDEEGLSTDNAETNSEEGSANFNDDGRNYDQQNRNSTHRKLTRDNCNYEDLYQVSNHSHSPRIRDDESSSNSPSLRMSSKTRMPRTNPMLSYSTNQNQLNLKHFGQRGDTTYESKPHHISTDSGYPMSRSDSNVEEVNKEMYRLQISRSQKALYNMENSKSSSEKFTATENTIPETNYPLDRAYSGAKVSGSRLNEDLERHQEYYGMRERRDSPSRAVFGRESQSSEASERVNVREARPEREISARDKLQRRLSLESARDLTDSSDEVDETLYSTTGRRRTSKHHRTIEQYEREIERLKCSVELLRGRLGPAEPGQDHTDAKMKAIISRLICVEEELRREQRKMAAALSHKQRVIEAQEHRIAALDEANTRLLSALVHLQQRAPHPAPTHSHHELQI
ncbi:unnamed protein product, partial [Iphiclides podalirius]